MGKIILRNLIRRRGRTLLTVIGIAVGIAAVVSLGAMARALNAGYSAMIGGTRSDLVVSQPDSLDISYSSVDESLADELRAMPEVADASGMLQGFVQAEGNPFFFVFGYPAGSFVLDRFQIVEGQGLGLRAPSSGRGTPALIGSVAAETLDLEVGDSLRLGDTVFRIAGIFESGDAFEDAGAVMNLEDAQILLGKPRQVSLYYIRLDDSGEADRFIQRMARRHPDLDVSTTDDFADSQLLDDALQAYAWSLAGLAMIIGGVGMMNAQLMSVSERTREIGVLRAVGWGRGRVLVLILSESIIVGLLGGLVGLGLGALVLEGVRGAGAMFGSAAASISPVLVVQGLFLVATLGVVAGLYPAYRASRLRPVEALRYEGGSGGRIRRLPYGGMEVQSLWQRSSRTLLTFAAIGMTVGTIMAMEAIIRGVSDQMTEIGLGAEAQVIIREADVADTSLSAIDERIGDRLASLPQVENVSGMLMYATLLPDSGGFFVLQGYAPNEYAIRRFEIVEGQPLGGNHQIVLGRMMAEAMSKDVGETIDLAGHRLRIVGIFETGIGWEELGGVVSLREAQEFAGRPRKVTLYLVKVKDPAQAPDLVDAINRDMSDVHAALTGDFASAMPDMKNATRFMNALSILAILVGGVGVLNTMLMAVHERTREIGVLRAVGWRRQAVLTTIIKEAVILGLLGGAVGIILAVTLIWGMNQLPLIAGLLDAQWDWDVFARAILVSLFLGLVGGLYPAYRATLMRPVEALRYE
ncbi:MAG TPA: FtsX-like permease family protein [Anaerolineales bacterium]|nr:FtsX-like permease family protein [Anaerolineales bacterium]